MIQLACILLIRQYLALNLFLLSPTTTTHEEKKEKEKKEESGNYNTETNQDILLSYSHQQSLVNMVYFEPFIKPIESKVLKDTFHVTVLDINEKGKRCIKSSLFTATTNEENDDDHIDNNIDNISSSSRKTTHYSTLFYMPHCPMRLYSNVLWANWSFDLLLDGRIIIFGNSFEAYDDRMISLEQRKDKTNAILPLLPFVVENRILVPQSFVESNSSNNNNLNANDDEDDDYDDAMRIITKTTPRSQKIATGDNRLSWQELEMAFNDSVLISFAINGSLNNATRDSWPSRPDEYIHEDGNGGEVA